jgi:hypothetical protein
VTLQEPHAQGVLAMKLYGSFYVEYVAEALGHLTAGECNHAMVGPSARESAIRVSADALGKLILMVRKAQIAATTVDVGPVRQMLLDHRRALYVPTRSS